MSKKSITPTVFITGPVGMIGSQLVRLFLKESDWNIYILLHETAVEMTLTDILRSYCGIDEPEKYTDRVQRFHGSITKKHLGMSKGKYQHLIAEVTHILHCAASTQFDLPLPEARKINCDGTAEIIALAEKCSNLVHLGFLSTVYVSGKRTGEIIETVKSENSAGFANTYEQSKFEAERLVADRTDTLPVSIYRLSTVIGHSETGAVSHFTAPHQTLRVMYLGLASMIPGTPEYTVDLIASDYSATTIFKLFMAGASDELVFHIVSGKNKSYSLQEVIDKSYAALAKADPEWKAKQHPKPTIAPPESFSLFMETVREANNPLLHNVLTALESFAHQLNYPKSFSTRNTESVLPTYNEEVPHIQEYYQKVVLYCVKTGWGKKSQHG